LPNKFFGQTASAYSPLDVVESSQIFFPIQNLERAYYSRVRNKHTGTLINF
jgi:hypothetical protein